MMKKFENPEIDVQKFNVEDIMTASSDDIETDKDMTDKG